MELKQKRELTAYFNFYLTWKIDLPEGLVAQGMSAECFDAVPSPLHGSAAEKRWALEG